MSTRPYSPATDAPNAASYTPERFRPLYTEAQYAAGQRVAGAVLDHGAYSYQDAAQISRCYVDHTPTLRST